MADIRFNIDEFRTESEAFTRFMNEFEQNMSDFVAAGKDVADAWEGSNAELMESIVTNIESQKNAYNEILTTYKTYIDNTIQAYEENEGVVGELLSRLSN